MASPMEFGPVTWSLASPMEFEEEFFSEQKGNSQQTLVTLFEKGLQPEHHRCYW